MTKDNVLINCWGENIEKNGIVTKKYLSYIMVKKQLIAIKKYYTENLNEFDYAEVTLNQETNEITFDFYSYGGAEKIIRTLLDKSTFYKIIIDIEG